MSKAVFLSIKAQPCVVCGASKTDACHIRSKGAGGGWEDWNLYPGCRTHHTEQHRIGIVSFYRKYPTVKHYFEAKGWRLEDVVGIDKLVHQNLEEV